MCRIAVYVNVASMTFDQQSNAPSTRSRIVVVSNAWQTIIMSSPHRAEALSDDARLSVAYIEPKSRTERSKKTKIGTEVGHVTRDSDTTFKVKLARGGGILWRPHALFVVTSNNNSNSSTFITFIYHVGCSGNWIIILLKLFVLYGRSWWRQWK